MFAMLLYLTDDFLRAGTAVCPEAIYTDVLGFQKSEESLMGVCLMKTHIRVAIAVLDIDYLVTDNIYARPVAEELKWEGKCYRLVIQRQRRNSGDLDLWEGEYTYRCILTNDYKSSTRDIVEFYNLRGGKERIFDDMNNGFGWSRLPKSFMAENTVFLLLTALIHNFYKTIMSRLDTKAFGLKKTSRIKAFVFRFISVPAKWIMTARQYVLNIYTENRAYAKPFKTEFG